MPTYLCHGFKWERQALRGWVVVHDVEDASPDWLVAPETHAMMLKTMAEQYPFVPFGPAWRRQAEEGDDAADDEEDEEGAWYSPVQLLEEYSATKETTQPMRPFAYVADHVVQVDWSVDVAEEMRRYEEKTRTKRTEEEEGAEGWWFERLRIGLRIFAEDTLDIGWFVVVCEDEERGWPEEKEEETKEEVKVDGKQKEEAPDKTKEKHREAGEVHHKKGLKSTIRGILPTRKKSSS